MEWTSVRDAMPPTRVKVLVCLVDKCGNKRILLAEHIGYREIEACDYLSEDVDDAWLDYDVVNDTFWAPEGWYEQVYIPEYGMFLDGTVAHWCFLPKFPEVVE